MISAAPFRLRLACVQVQAGRVLSILLDITALLTAAAWKFRPNPAEAR